MEDLETAESTVDRLEGRLQGMQQLARRHASAWVTQRRWRDSQDLPGTLGDRGSTWAYESQVRQLTASTQVIEDSDVRFSPTLICFSSEFFFFLGRR